MWHVSDDTVELFMIFIFHRVILNTSPSVPLPLSVMAKLFQTLDCIRIKNMLRQSVKLNIVDIKFLIKTSRG